MMRHELLLLLLGKEPLDRAAQWRDALQQRQPPCTSTSGDADQDTTAFIEALDAVVPHIPVFHDHLSARIEALFAHCQQVHSAAFARFVRAWLQRSDTSRAFRMWLHDWLSRSLAPVLLAQDTNDSDASEKRSEEELTTDTELWQSALCAALLAEEDPALKRTLLRLLSELEPSSQHSSDNLTADTKDTELELSSVEALLDFYWTHARELAPFALLCASKLHALAQQQQTHAQLTDSVVVRLRWSKLFAPLLFEPLLHHCAALHVFQATNVTLDAHTVLQQLVQSAQWTQTQTQQLARLHATADRLERACDANAVHVALPRTSGGSWATAASSKLLQSLPVAQQQLVLLDLERDLALAPAPLLPHLLLVFGTVVRAIACDPDADDAVVATAMQSLVALVELQSDARSCYLLAALVLQLRVHRLRVWTSSPALFVQVVEALSALAVVEANRSKRWLVRMLQQQLLFECDVSAVATNLSALAEFLPVQQLQLLHLRCQT